MKTMSCFIRTFLSGFAAHSRRFQRGLPPILLLLTQTLSSADTNWMNSSLGDWFLPANWHNGIPSSTTDCFINKGGTALLTAPSAETLDLYIGTPSIGSDTGTLLLASGPGTRGGLEVSGSLLVGWALTATSDVGNGTLNVTGGASLRHSPLGQDSNYLRVGDAPNGSTGRVLVSDSGSLLQIASIYVGGGTSHGIFRIENRGVVQSDGVVLGGQYGSDGMATVTGAGSLWSANVIFSIGRAGTGTLRIEDGGLVQSRAVFLGEQAGSDGTATVTGAGSQWSTNDTFVIGSAGTGALTISGAGKVVTPGTAIGKVPGANGAVTVTGNGSLLDNSAGLVYVGGDPKTGQYGGTGTLRILNGGQVRADSMVVFNTSSVEVNNGSSTVDGLMISNDGWYLIGNANLGNVTIGSTSSGRMSVLESGILRDGTAVLGLNPGTVGAAVIEGYWNNDGDLVVGAAGAGTVEIRAGGDVYSLRGHVGLHPGSSGTVIVSDPFSSWIASGSQFIGNGGTGRLEVLNGGVASAAGHGYLGFAASSSTGTAVVSGAGSRWNIAQNLSVGGNGAAPGGTGLLRIENGGWVKAATATLYNTGTLTGDGTLTAGTVNNGGTVAPGNSAGRLTINGDYNQTSDGKLAIELGGYTPGTGYDQLAVSGSATVGGTLSLSLLNGFRPNAGDSFQIITSNGQSGNFSAINCPGFTVRSDPGPSGIVLTIINGIGDLVVTNTDDDGAGSLRAIIANAAAGCVITFAPNVRGTINLTSGELLIDKNLTISGPGANLLTLQRSGAAGTLNFRIFNIGSNTAIASISGLTIANGNTNAGGAGNGGGISNGGTLTLANSIISGNTASSSSAGGILNSSGTLTIINSTISGNLATGGFGGGIWNYSGTLTITNSTISGNSATEAGFGIGIGGGIFNDGGTVTLTNSTISGNTAQFRGGGMSTNTTGTLRARNTIIALNTSPSGPDVYGPLTSEGFNLIGNNAGAIIAPAQSSDQIGVTAAQLNLGPLQANGGPTHTHALLSGSFAIDKGHSSGSPTDQRGFVRLVDNPAIPNAIGGDGGDTGAFEFGSAAPSLDILSVTRSGNGDVVLLVSGVPNGVHRVQASIDLITDSFIDIATVTADATGVFQFQDTRAGLTRNFLRVVFP